MAPDVRRVWRQRRIIGNVHFLYYNYLMARIRFVFLTASPFSGSTLFSLLVNAHPEIATVGEMTGPTSRQNRETYQCSCGERMTDCQFWLQVKARMELQGFPFDPGRFDTRISLGSGYRGSRILSGSLGNSALENARAALLAMWPKQRDRLHYLMRRNIELARSVLHVTGKSVFFDASKSPMTIRHLANQSEIDLRVVHLVRDVRGAALSKRKNQQKTNWRQNVSSWVRTNRNIERQLAILPAGHWLRLRYEDLCRSPELTLSRVFEFCGVGLPTTRLEFTGQEHHIVGNRMRLGKVSEVQVDESWRRILLPEELILASRMAGSMQNQYGYPAMSTADLEQ